MSPNAPLLLGRLPLLFPDHGSAHLADGNVVGGRVAVVVPCKIPRRFRLVIYRANIFLLVALGHDYRAHAESHRTARVSRFNDDQINSPVAAIYPLGA
jgi:hypothetical protein